MTIGKALYTLLIGPLELFFEVLYSIAYRLVESPGLAIIFLSLAMNFLVLPLYMRADAMQSEQIETEKRLQPWIKHIKKTFKGDERFMMLQAFYRQNNYKPTQILRSSVSLFLEIPFFIAAYRFLSGLQLMNGVSFGLIKDLGQADGMIAIGAISINLLPILMTAINIVSSAIYTKGAPLKSKLQLYGIALIFLVLLYKSPAGLVFYWTLNNLFSLIKNIFYKLKEPKKVLSLLSAACGIALLIAMAINPPSTTKRVIAGLILAIALLMPGIKILAASGRIKIGGQEKLSKLKAAVSGLLGAENGSRETSRLFYASCVFLSVFCGLLIPSMVIKASPAEFIDSATLENPSNYLIEPFILAIGIFVIWFSVFYGLGSKKDKTIIGTAVWALCGIAVLDYMCFGTELGNLSNELVYETKPVFTTADMLWGLLLALVVAVLFALAHRKAIRISAIVCTAAIIAVAAMSIANIKSIQPEIKENIAKLELSENENANISLSDQGQNVVVIMLDRAISDFIPYMINEKPELKEQLKGFTYYSNTLSYGSATNVASPALYGGYEYTPVEMNARSSESLESKQNEALKVMPVLFENNDYEVTVCDPTYAGYDWIPDLSIYDDYPDINKYITKGIVNEGSSIELNEVGNLDRNLLCYSFFRIAPDAFKGVLYNRGVYNEADQQIPYQQLKNGVRALPAESGKSGGSDNASSSEASGIPLEEDTAAPVEGASNVMEFGVDVGTYEAGTGSVFMKSYRVLDSLPEITNVYKGQRGKKNTFTMLSNDTTHDISVVQEPDYKPAELVNNTAYEAEHSVRTAEDGSKLNVNSIFMQKNYQSNMAAWVALGEWCEYLQEQGVYDNTRIIVVSDHGYNIGLYNNYAIAGKDLMCFNALLMVKDFNASGFTTNDSFMTNADVATLATKGLISNATNPFTGKAINSKAKSSGDQRILTGTPWETSVNNGNVFLPGNWISMTGTDIKDINNWKYLGNY